MDDKRVGTMTCECGEVFELMETDDREWFEDNLTEHMLGHQADRAEPR